MSYGNNFIFNFVYTFLYAFILNIKYYNKL